MQYVIGIGIALFVIAQFPWLIVIIAGIGVVAVIAIGLQEANLSEEEKTVRRRQQQEYQHAQRMCQLQQQHQKEVTANETRHGLLNTAGKIGVSLLFHALTNGAHKSRH